MRSLIAGCVMLVFALAAGVQLWEKRKDDIKPIAEEKFTNNTVTRRSTARPKPANFQTAPGYARTVVIPAASNRQFYVNANVNNQSTRFLIDTGAVAVALRESDLQRAGILLRQEDFRFTVSTANGETSAARVKLDDIEIQGIHVGNVDAFVLPDHRLDTNLLGMSFLSELSSVETRNGKMVLTQ